MTNPTPPLPSPGLLAVCALLSICVCHCIYVSYGSGGCLRRNKKGIPMGRMKDEASQMASVAHSLVTIVIAWCTVLHIGPEGIGAFACTYSAAYMTWDIWCMLDVQYEHLAALVAHHTLSASSMFYISLFEPRAVWYACLLLTTETTVPFKSVVDFAEIRAKSEGKSKDFYVQSWMRWTLLVAWIVFRIAVFVPFLYAVANEWNHMTPGMQVLGVNGPFLLLFNVLSLFKAILPGFPWTSEAKKRV